MEGDTLAGDNSMRILSSFLVVTLGMAIAQVAPAQEMRRDMVAERPDAEAPDSWYEESPTIAQPTPQMIIQQKAQMRAMQRIARMESMKWYGMSASRPLYNATPFSGVPSPRYEMPGGRPFAWHPAQQQVLIVR